ncbi:camp-dependent protein kinase catalytic subunit PRKX-like protein, partial [Ramicandelaber brevisporus]
LSDFSAILTLGTGTFARVLLVQRRGTNEFYALKRLLKADIVRLQQVDHVNNERSILAVINFPFIVNLRCTFHDDRFLYILLDYVPGGELFSHLRRYQKFPFYVAQFYSSEVTLALEYLHAQNIIYRDLKPENILIGVDGHIKLADFGFAKRVVDRTYTLCGTSAYLAPEIITGGGHTKAVDWWAMGILVYEMLVGAPPFDDENPVTIYAKILESKINFPQFVGKVERDFIRRLLNSDLTRRLGNMRGGAVDVRMHPFFERIDWTAVLQRRYQPPIVPPYKHPGDSSNFERYPEQPVRTTLEPGEQSYNELFPGF